jgi:hypothetical protein
MICAFSRRFSTNNSVSFALTLCKKYPSCIAVLNTKSQNFSDLSKEINAFFLTNDNSDKELFECIFDYANTSATHFKFRRYDGGIAEIFLRSPNRLIFHYFLRYHSHAIRFRASIIDITIASGGIEHSDTLDHEGIKQTTDHTLISIWNSRSFNQVSIGIPSLNYARIFTRTDYFYHPKGCTL